MNFKPKQIKALTPTIKFRLPDGSVVEERLKELWRLGIYCPYIPLMTTPPVTQDQPRKRSS